MQKTYTVSLETSLSSHLYRIDTGSRVDLVVGSDKHITLHFDATVSNLLKINMNVRL